MERNDDKRQVVLDADMYEWLLGMARFAVAEDGTAEKLASLQKLEKHVRKFNMKIRGEEAYARLVKASRDSAAKKWARRLVQVRHGREVYRKTAFGFTPVILKGPGLSSKGNVRIVTKYLGNPNGVLTIEIRASQIVTEVPAEYLYQESGAYQGHYVHKIDRSQRIYRAQTPE